MTLKDIKEYITEFVAANSRTAFVIGTLGVGLLVGYGLGGGCSKRPEQASYALCAQDRAYSKDITKSKLLVKIGEQDVVTQGDLNESLENLTVMNTSTGKLSQRKICIQRINTQKVPVYQQISSLKPGQKETKPVKPSTPEPKKEMNSTSSKVKALVDPVVNPYEASARAYETLAKKLGSSIDSNTKQLGAVVKSLEEIRDYIRPQPKEEPKKQETKTFSEILPNSQESQQKNLPTPQTTTPSPSASTPLASLVPVYDRNITSIRRIPDSNNITYFLVEFKNGNKLQISGADLNNPAKDLPFLIDLPYKDLDRDAIEDLIVTFPNEREQILFSGRYDHNTPNDPSNRPNLFIPSGLHRQVRDQ
jgi:hypothetical protein